MIERREIWDEFRWEDFMLERDKKVERAMELLYRERPVADASGWSWLMGELPEIDDDDTDDGEEWKCETLQPWRLAQDFAAHALKVVESMAERPKSESGTGSGADSAVVDFVSNAMIAPGTIARGMSFGGEPGGGGANIAYCKRGLAAANSAISALREMRLKGILGGTAYHVLAAEAAEARDAIALHVAELREAFLRNRG